VRHHARTTHFAASFGAAVTALVFVGIVTSTGAMTDPVVAVAAGAGVAAIAAFVVSWMVGARYRARARAIVDVGRRYALGDFSRPGADYGDDELGAAARALDAAAHEQERRVTTLMRDRARMEAILGSMVEGVLVVDGGGRLQLVNDAARQLLRIQGDAMGRPYGEALRHPGVVEQIGRALTDGTPLATELSTSRDGARELAARIAPVAGTGRGVVVVLHDITDLKRTDRIRRDFVANVSHELRTPLTAIRGAAEALTDDPADADERRRFLGMIQRHAARMERLVKDLLRLAMLDAGKEALDAAPTDVPALVGAVIDDLAAAAASKRLHVTVDVDAATRGLRIDASKVHDILRNLVENAVSYTPDGGAITVSGSASDGMLALRVADTGPGIPPEDLGRVFERFYRVDKSRGLPGGTGLGLAIAKHLAELHGGAVGVANRATGGAQFDVSLRVSAADPGDLR
jgi:two-component system phosphate regulon sensor histidine kinase PhoR